MAKIDIVKKDGKKYIDGEEVLLKITYSILGRLMLLVFSLFGIFSGSIFVMAFNTNILLIILGGLIEVYSIIMFIDLLFFDKFEITKYHLTKRWLFWKYSLAVDDAIVYKTSYLINRGAIRFKTKNNHFLWFILPIYLLAVDDYKITMEKLKTVFLEINLLKGDEYEWYN